MTASVPLMATNLVLTVVPPAAAIRVGDYPRFAVTISNRGPGSVTLASPGDGSDCDWRTPAVDWSILRADVNEQKHPESPPRGITGRCGNINPLKLSEVFSLKPGQSKRLESWIGHPSFDKAGRYRLVFYYQNIPTLEVSGIPLGPHEKGVFDRIRKSTPCRLTSEEIVVDILPKLAH